MIVPKSHQLKDLIEKSMYGGRVKSASVTKTFLFVLSLVVLTKVIQYLVQIIC
jgi:hypothetical protein